MNTTTPYRPSPTAKGQFCLWRREVPLEMVLLPELAPYIMGYSEVYLFDRCRAIHLCEFTPSYEMRYLYGNFALAADTPDSVRDAIADAELGMDNESEPVIYVHCHKVKGERHVASVTAREIARTAGGYDGVADALVEHYRNNPEI